MIFLPSVYRLVKDGYIRIIYYEAQNNKILLLS